VGGGRSTLQAEYLAFIRTFTERWGVPPSFEEIPGQARTLRVIVPEGSDTGAKPRPGRTAPRDDDMKAAVHLACLVIERLVPALKSATDKQLWSAFDAVSSAVEVVFLAAGASAKEQQEAHAALRRAALVAQGMSPETRPGRTLPWSRRER
jgi:hypothetical protein